MALGWITLLKTVPWADVISTAPVVADGAKKLWKTVAKKPEQEMPEAAVTPTAQASTRHDETLRLLSAQIAVLEQEAAQSHEQMLESSKLISALAEQNTQLIARVEMHRRRVSWLCAACAALAVLGVSNLALLLAR